MQGPDRAAVRLARVIAADAGRVGGHGADLVLDHIGVFPERDGVAIGFRHLLPVQPRHLRGPGQQRPGFREDGLARAVQITGQPLAVADADILLRFEQGAGLFQRRGLALFLIIAPQAMVKTGVLFAHFFERRLHPLLKIRLAAIEMIEAARHLARQFHMRDLILAHGHMAGLVDDNVRGLEQRIAQKAIGRQVLAGELFLLILVARHALQPA